MPPIHELQAPEPILGGMGIPDFEHPRGIISDRRARAEKVGGEVLALVH